MAVGARDHIDKLLVQKYQTLQVDNHNDINHVNEIAKYLNTINYEIMCNIGNRVERVYKN